MTTETNYAEQLYASISNESDILKKNTEGYPFSAVARFLLLYHSKKNNEPSFDQLATQSAIYFNNIPWIQYQLTGVNGKAKNSEEIAHSQIQQQLNTADEQITDISDPEIKYETETLGFSEEENKSVLQEETKETQYVANEQITDISDQEIKYETETLGFSEEENKSVLQEEPQETQYASNEQITDISDQGIKYETETLGVSDEEPQEVAFTANGQNIGNSIQESENEEQLIAFEPLHTVDYFASQGIKISEEALENDHLGQQVKSFTAWLKSMKKLHPGQLPEQNEVIEKIIQSSAEVSNQNANILTEAMAEVLMKQGKREKAIEMFEKLSLMNPSKSAYFAAKIESLKTI
jgi:DNA-dependent RNA polymerase auxiliary subunit epsilon